MKNIWKMMKNIWSSRQAYRLPTYHSYSISIIFKTPTPYTRAAKTIQFPRTEKTRRRYIFRYIFLLCNCFAGKSTEMTMIYSPLRDLDSSQRPARTTSKPRRFFQVSFWLKRSKGAGFCTATLYQRFQFQRTVWRISPQISIQYSMTIPRSFEWKFSLAKRGGLLRDLPLFAASRSGLCRSGCTATKRRAPRLLNDSLGGQTRLSPPAARGPLKESVTEVSVTVSGPETTE